MLVRIQPPLGPENPRVFAINFLIPGRHPRVNAHNCTAIKPHAAYLGAAAWDHALEEQAYGCLLYTSPSPRDS